MVSKDLQGKILFPWDGSPLSEQAVDLAMYLARLLGTQLVVFRVVLPPRADLVAAPNLSDELMEAAHSTVEAETERLCAACGEEVRRGLEMVVMTDAGEKMDRLREELQDRIAAEIVGRMAKPDIGLVVLGSHGATANKLKPRGGVAMRAINGASKPVLVVPLLPPWT